MNHSAELTDRLQQMDQHHLLHFWDELSSDERAELTRQVSAIDFEEIASLFAGGVTSIDWHEIARRALPPRAFRLHDSESNIKRDEAIAEGERLLNAGKVGMILVAGGQGSRLGFDLPKGMFEIGPVSRRTLFQVIIDQLRAREIRHGARIPLLIMTSPATHVQTIEYFRDNNMLGLNEDQVEYFCQGTMPAVDADSGKVLRDSRSTLALSPDGHGGMLSAFDKSGLLESCLKQEVEHLFFCQIDNPLVNVCDPLLMGFHSLSGSEMTTQVVRKEHALEKVGNVVQLDGKVQIIEYSDLPEEIARQTDENGELRLWAGNIAVHVFGTKFLSRAAKMPHALPFHVARKKVAYITDSGDRIEPDSPNAVKFERFVFDLLPHAANAIAVEAHKATSFAPVKNADGEPFDTPSQAKRAMVALHRSWLQNAGIEIPNEVDVEIDPLFALDESEVGQKRELIAAIDRPTFVTG